MKSANPYSIHPKHLHNANARRRSEPGSAAPTPAPTPSPTPSPTPGPEPSAVRFRTTPRDFVNPVDYRLPYDSMGRFAKALALEAGGGTGIQESDETTFPSGVPNEVR